MRLLEMFALLELKDRLSHIAQTLARKVHARWQDQVIDGGFAGVPQEVKQAVSDGSLPNPDEPTFEQTDPELSSRWFVEWFSQFDPTKNKKYTDWIVRQWLKDKLWLEDAYKLTNTLEAFEEHRKKLARMDIVDQEGDPLGPPPERRADINAWQDYRALAYAMRPLVGTRAAGEKVQNFLTKPEVQDMMSWPVPDPVKTFGPEEGEFDIDELRSAYAGETGEDGGDFDTMDWYNYGGEDTEATTAIEKVYADDKIAILTPNTRAAACELGRGTEWCTAATTSDNYFWNYAPDGPMYVVLTDKHGKYQFHFESGQFMDVHDVPITDKAKAELAQEYPQLGQVFHDKAADHGQVWLMDPSKVTPEWVAQKAREAMAGSGYGMDHMNLLRSLPTAMAGKADEAALQEAEAFLRHHDPLYAWKHVREPTEDDYKRALYAEDTSIRGYDPSTGIIQDALSRGMELSDETLEALVARNGEVILYLSPEKVQANPGWALGAIQNQPRVLETALRSARGEPGWGDLEDEGEKARMANLVAVIRSQGEAGVKAVMNALHHDPDMVHLTGYWFGTAPWIWAMNKNRESNHPSGMKQSLMQIPADAEGWNWDDILAWFMQDESNMMTMDMDFLSHLNEVYNGRLPERFVAALPQGYQQALGVGQPSQFSAHPFGGLKLGSEQ